MLEVLAGACLLGEWDRRAQVRGHPLLTLQRREGRPAELFMAMLDPGELLFTLDTLAERAPAAVFGPEALRLREQARRAGLEMK